MNNINIAVEFNYNAIVARGVSSFKGSIIPSVIPEKSFRLFP